MAISKRAFTSKLSQPLDAASVVAFRAGFGVLTCVSVLRFFLHGWIHEYFLVPRHFFPYYGFGWVRPWPGGGMYVHFAIMAVLAALVAAGAFYRLSIALFGAAFAYAHLVDQTNYLNHYYLVICLSVLMAILPLHVALSVDAWRKPALKSCTVPAWVLYALRAQVAVVYLFGGFAKLNPDWLLRAQPLKMWLSASTDFPVLGRFFDQPWAAFAMSYAGAAFDLSITGLLLWRRSRPWAFAALVAFHLVTARLFQLGMFPWIMITSALVFFSPDWPRRVITKLRWKEPDAGGRPPVASGVERGPLIPALLTAWFTIQLLIPLRHLLYPGNVFWTEEGFRFSWNVMLMEKDGSAEFRVTERSSGKHWTVVPGDYLTRYQVKMMSTQPDMLLRFAHVIADDFRAHGIRDPEVRADVFVALNGRHQARLIDPDVDLARQHDGFEPKRWILPMPADDEKMMVLRAEEDR